MRVAGVDGCRGGWAVATADVREGRLGPVSVAVVATFAEVLAQPLARVAVDIPIGLLDEPEAGGRAADREARMLLGPVRGTSVFPAPVRPALRAPAPPAAMPHGLGLTLQSWAIVPKICEVDELVAGHQLGDPSASGPIVLETHPEVVFADLAGAPMLAPKRTKHGLAERVRLLARALGSEPSVAALPGASPDDVADALACLWVAAAGAGEAEPLPRAAAPVDGRGLRMQIWRRRPDGRELAAPAPLARPLARAALENAAVAWVLELERAAGRDPVDRRHERAFPADLESTPRVIGNDHVKWPHRDHQNWPHPRPVN